MIDRYRTHLGRVFRQSLISVRKKTRARATDELTEERTKAFNRDANARVLSLSLSLSLSFSRRGSLLQRVNPSFGLVRERA